MPAKVTSGHKSQKHEIISKTNTNMVIAIGIATFVVVFCAFASKALISQSFYQGRVVAEKEKALKQLKENESAVVDLKKTYDAFQSESQNILGGNPSGDGALDGSNAQLVLDALPNKYDYPALSSSFEKILRDGGYEIGTIGGAEDTSLAENNEATSDAKPIEVSYGFSVTSSLDGTKTLLRTLENSIRPMYVDSLRIQTSASTLTTRVELRTYFTQPKTFQLGSKEVK